MQAIVSDRDSRVWDREAGKPMAGSDSPTVLKGVTPEVSVDERAVRVTDRVRSYTLSASHFAIANTQLEDVLVLSCAAHRSRCAQQDRDRYWLPVR